MDSALGGTILGQLAMHHPEPVEAIDMFLSNMDSYSTMDGFVDALNCLTDEGLVKVITRSGLHSSLSLTEKGLEFVLKLVNEALEVASASGNVAEA